MKPSNRIFTLIELLIVIAIIAILAAMLLPALRKAMARAHSVGCLNNLKTISSACNFYSMDYNDWIIPSGAQINKAWCYNLAYGFRSPVTAKGNPYGLKYDVQFIRHGTLMPPSRLLSPARNALEGVVAALILA